MPLVAFNAWSIFWQLGVDRSSGPSEAEARGTRPEPSGAWGEGQLPDCEWCLGQGTHDICGTTRYGRARRHPTDFIHPLNYLDFKLRTDNSARRQWLAGPRLPTEAQGTTCGPRPRTGGGRLQATRAGSPASAHSTRHPRGPDSEVARRAPSAPQRRDRSPDHGAGPGLLPSRSSGGCRGRGAAPHPARTLPRSLQMGLSAAK